MIFFYYKFLLEGCSWGVSYKNNFDNEKLKLYEVVLNNLVLMSNLKFKSWIDSNIPCLFVNLINGLFIILVSSAVGQPSDITIVLHQNFHWVVFLLLAVWLMSQIEIEPTISVDISQSHLVWMSIAKNWSPVSTKHVFK